MSLVMGMLAPTAAAVPRARAADATIVDGSPDPAAREVSAMPRHGAIAIDGVLDEAAWSTARVHGHFYQRAPLEGQPPRFPTEFRVLYDSAAVYVGIYARDPHPDQIRGLLTRRDEESASDWLMVGIDSYHDRRTAFVFAVNPAGVQRDFMIFDDAKDDVSWNAVWESAARIADGGWVAEFRIPYNQLRFASADEQRWGLQVVRLVARTNEETAWTRWPQASSQIVSKFGTLDGIRGIAPSHRIELLPYTTGGVVASSPAPDDPFSDGLDGRGTVGLDVKYGLTSNLTLSGTLNPDFGQVEADPSEVNLTAYESFFAEKRPFFVEGAEIFGFSMATGDGDDAVEKLFYSRRIGGAPHATGEDAVLCPDPPAGGQPICYAPSYVDEPTETTIYGAAKLSGKTASGWSVGVLDAVTAQESSRVMFGDPEATRQTVTVEPLTNYGVLRLRKDFGRGRTVIDGALTSVHRQLSGTGLEPLLHDQAYSGGLLLSHRFAHDRWMIDARLVGSLVHGSPEAMIETQTSSRRYYQRPDATHLHFDPTRTSLAGAGLIWSAGKVDGGHWRGAAGGDLRSPGLEVNDLGFQRNADQYVQWYWMQYRDDQPGRLFRNYQINTNLWVALGRSPLHLSHGGNINGSGTLLGYWSGNLGVSIDRPLWNTRALRGGPALRDDVSGSLWASLSTDGRKMVRGSLTGTAWLQPASDSWNWSVTPAVAVQARSNLDLSVGPTLSQSVNRSQYVDEALECVPAPGDDCSTQVSHYILARMRMVQTALTVRMNYTFSPTLSLQLYAQPFLGAYRFSDYKEADRPRERSYQDRFHRFTPGEISIRDGIYFVDRDRDGQPDFGFELADFSFRQLRSNLVLRWEYRPGSSLFLIWSHDRTTDDSVADFGLDRGLDALAGEGGEHVVMLKLNYWVGV